MGVRLLLADWSLSLHTELLFRPHVALHALTASPFLPPYQTTPETTNFLQAANVGGPHIPLGVGVGGLQIWLGFKKTQAAGLIHPPES